MLAEALAARKGIGAIPVLRRYERWRNADNLSMLAAVDGFKRLFGSELAVVRWVRSLGLDRHPYDAAHQECADPPRHGAERRDAPPGARSAPAARVSDAAGGRQPPRTIFGGERPPGRFPGFGGERVNLLNVVAVLLTLTALFAYVNYRVVRLPTTIGVMFVALVLSLALIVGGKLGFHGLDEHVGNLLRSIDFHDAAAWGHAQLPAVRGRAARQPQRPGRGRRR